MIFFVCYPFFNTKFTVNHTSYPKFALLRKMVTLFCHLQSCCGRLHPLEWTDWTIPDENMVYRYTQINRPIFCGPELDRAPKFSQTFCRWSAENLELNLKKSVGSSWEFDNRKSGEILLKIGRPYFHQIFYSFVSKFAHLIFLEHVWKRVWKIKIVLNKVFGYFFL